MPSTQPNPDDTQAMFVTFMRLFGRAQVQLKARMHGLMDDALGPLHLRALQLIGDMPGMTQRELGAHMGRDKGQIARLTRELEDAGYVQRSAHPQDNRAWCLHTSAQGHQSSLQFSALEARYAAELLHALNEPERAQLQALLERLLSHSEQL